MKKQKTVHKLIAFICLLSLSFALVLLPACDQKEQQIQEKKAIIIVPGLLASALYDADTGKIVWDPFVDTDLWVTDFVGHQGMNFATILALAQTEKFQEELSHITANGGKGDGESFLYKVCAMNDDGTSKFNIKPVPFSNETRAKYGFLNAQTDIYNYFETNYGKDYEVSVFNYDWRLDNRYNGRLLQEYIEQNGYDKVILVSHSNGGLVTACYLALSEENRNKVELNLSYDAPYLGASMALTTLENLEHMTDGVYDLLDSFGMSGLSSVVNTAFHEQFLPLINMYDIYQLLPTYEMLTTPHLYNEIITESHVPWHEPTKSFITKQEPYFTIYDEKGQKKEIYFDSAEELYEFYCSRPWAHLDNDVNKPLRVAMQDWLDYCNSMYVLTDEGYVHSTTLVNTYYFCGTGYDTDYCVQYENYGTEYEECSFRRDTILGDGTVLLYSATAGITQGERIRTLPCAGHFDPVQQFSDFSKETTEEILNDFFGK